MELKEFNLKETRVFFLIVINFFFIKFHKYVDTQSSIIIIVMLEEE